MKTLMELLPLAIVVAVMGAVTSFLLTREWAIGPWLLAGLLLAHGWVHLMFVFPQPDPAAAAAGGTAWPFDMGGSWLIGGVGLDIGLVRTVGMALMAVVFVGFTLAALSSIGVVIPADWWAGLVVGAAAGSFVLLTMFISPMFLLGYAIDLALLWLVFASVWGPTGIGIP